MMRRGRKSKKSAEAVASNEDLLTEILSRLPIKPLFRFKSVSPYWLHLISSTHFSKTHTLRNPIPSTPPGLLLHHYPHLTYISLLNNYHHPHSRPSFGPVPVLDFLHLPHLFSCVTILSSCNGLLLCLLVPISPPPRPRHDIDILYVVCNPTTEKSNLLPRLSDLSLKPVVNMDLAFDPSLSPHYKVVCTRHCTPPTGSHFEIQVFSSETGAWKTCRQGPFSGFRAGMLFQGGTYWNKRIHYVDPHDADSVYFDLEGETVGSMRMPRATSEVVSMKRSWYLGRAGGHLQLVDIETNVTRESCVAVYEMKEDFSGWVLRCRVGVAGMEAGFEGMVAGVEDAVPCLEGTDRRFRVGRYYSYCLLGLVRMEDEGNGVGYEFILSIPNRITCYNPATGGWRSVVFFRDDRDRRGFDWHNVGRFAGSLAPL